MGLPSFFKAMSLSRVCGCKAKIYWYQEIIKSEFVPLVSNLYPDKHNNQNFRSSNLNFLYSSLSSPFLLVTTNLLLSLSSIYLDTLSIYLFSLLVFYVNGRVQLNVFDYISGSTPSFCGRLTSSCTIGRLKGSQDQIQKLEIRWKIIFRFFFNNDWSSPLR